MELESASMSSVSVQTLKTNLVSTLCGAYMCSIAVWRITLIWKNLHPVEGDHWESGSWENSYPGGSRHSHPLVSGIKKTKTKTKASKQTNQAKSQRVMVPPQFSEPQVACEGDGCPRRLCSCSPAIAFLNSKPCEHGHQKRGPGTSEEETLLGSRS